MKRSSKLLIAATALWTLAMMLACNNGQQNNNAANNPNKPNDNSNTNANALPPPPTPIPPAVACGQANTADRATMVQQSLTQHITQTGGKLNEEYTATTPKFAFRAVVFPPGPNPGDPPPDALVMVIGGSISGKNIFPALNSLLAPYMAQNKCVMRVVFVPTVALVPPSYTITSLAALPGGFGWSGCEYPQVACPSGMCADAGSCNGAIDLVGTASPAATSSANGATNTSTAADANTAHSNSGSNGNSGPPANRP